MSSKLWIGLISFYVIAQVICNFVENDPMLTATNVAEMQAMAEYTETTTVTDTGTSITFFDKAWDFISRVVFFDYTLFKDVDPATGDTTANNWVVFRYLLIAIGVVVIVEVFLVGRRLVLG